MPEVQPPTLQGLVKFLKDCPGWDYRNLDYQYSGFDRHQVGYGPRSLFWLPTVPKRKEFVWLDGNEGYFEDRPKPIIPEFTTRPVRRIQW